jgi:hypothetical protein
MTNQQIMALRMLAEAIEDACKAGGAVGAPGGVIYSALTAHGVTFQQYQQIMSGMVRAGRIVKRGECYFPAAKA